MARPRLTTTLIVTAWGISRRSGRLWPVALVAAALLGGAVHPLMSGLFVGLTGPPDHIVAYMLLTTLVSDAVPVLAGLLAWWLERLELSDGAPLRRLR